MSHASSHTSSHSSTASDPSRLPAELSAPRLHALALEAFRVGNRGRLSLCDVFRVLGETRLYLDLGFPNLAAYADACFQLRRSEAFEYVRVARALVELTELREAFGRGRIGWSALKAITRVATAESQSSWIEFSREHGIERTLAEARDALRRGRDAPRKGSFGLPNLDQRLVLRFPRSDMEKVRGWIEDACATIAAATGAEHVSLEQALLFLCEHDMASAPAPASATHRAQVVYQRCPDCTNARVATRDGFVEVDAAEVERFEGSAEKVVIDGPTPPRLRRQVLGRDGQRCANPRCHNRADHCHHIRFRSQGGGTTLQNETAVCRTCHALIHAGLLRVAGNANGSLDWSPVVEAESLEPDLAAGADELPVLQLVADPDERSRESAVADSRLGSADSLDLDALARGLTRLGIPARRSRQMIDAAVAALPPTARTEANVLQRALASA